MIFFFGKIFTYRLHSSESECDELRPDFFSENRRIGTKFATNLPTWFQGTLEDTFSGEETQLTWCS